MRLALIEMRREKLRFGLLTGAVSLLIFLVLFLSALSGALVNSFTGAFSNLEANVLVYSDSARGNIQGSRLEPGIVAAVAAVPGVAAAGGLATTTVSAELPDGKSDLSVFGYTPDAPGTPGGLTEGRLPNAANETAADIPGADIGDTITLLPTNIKLTIVGLLKGAQFNAAPTAYIDLTSYVATQKAANPSAPFVPINAVAVNTDPGASASAVADQITSAVPQTKGYTLSNAISSIPGVSSVTQTFGILVGLTFIIGIVVIGFFFLILTVQKMKVFTLLRATGASTWRLTETVSIQITAVVFFASIIASLLTYGALQGVNTGIPVSLSPVLVVIVVLAVWIFSLLTGLLSARRIRAIDPASAAGAR